MHILANQARIMHSLRLYHLIQLLEIEAASSLLNFEILVSPVTTRRLGSVNLIRDICETRTNELRGMNSCTLVSVGGECSFSGVVLSLFKLQ